MVFNFFKLSPKWLLFPKIRALSSPAYIYKHIEIKEMEITKNWLLSNRTKNGAWTKRQLQVLGIEWPPKKGWQKVVIGENITEQEKSMFETSKLDKVKRCKK